MANPPKWWVVAAVLTVAALMPSRAAPQVKESPQSDDDEVIHLGPEAGAGAIHVPMVGPRQISNYIAIAQIVLAALMALRSWSPVGQVCGSLLVYADTWLLLGALPDPGHTIHCRSVTAIVVATSLALAVGARVAVFMGVAICSAFPRNWLLWPKRSRESQRDDNQNAATCASASAAPRNLRRQPITAARLSECGQATARSMKASLEEQLDMPCPVELSIQYL